MTTIQSEFFSRVQNSKLHDIFLTSKNVHPPFNKYSNTQLIHWTFRQESTQLSEKQGDVDFFSGNF